MFFSETWLRPSSIEDNFLMIKNFTLHRRDRQGRTHGGLLTYVKNTIKSRRRHDLEDEKIECITVQLTIQNTNHLYFCCYRPPDQSVDTFFNTLSQLLHTAEQESTSITILGDFNAKHALWDLDSTPNPAGTRLYQLSFDFSLSQLVRTHTRVSSDGHSFSTIDLFLTNRPDIVCDVTVSAPVSDHCCVSACIKIPKPRAHTHNTPRTSTLVPDFSRADWCGMCKALQNSCLLTSIQGTSDINVAWETWKLTVLVIAKRYIPMRTIIHRPKNKKWMTAELHKLSRTKLRLFRAARRSRSASDWRVYTIARNKCTQAFRKAKTQYFSRKRLALANEADGSRRWWCLAKELARIQIPKEPIPDLISDGGTTASADKGKAELLAAFFASQSTDKNPSADLCGAPFPLPENHPAFDFRPLTNKDILYKLRALPSSKTTADPILTNRTLRECADCLSPSLTYLFNLSLSTNSFPSEWKQAVVTPIFKKRGEASNPSNYRPVSLLHAVGKVLDSLVTERLLRYLTEKSLITPHQFGFLPKRSTTTQLVYVLHKWFQSLDDGHYVYAVFLDFMKAFDRVWHDGLIYKLLQLGLSLDAVAWFRSYLSNRSLQVRVGASLSQPHPLTAGVPQGSHLGPILFLVFINDLPASVNIPTELFADDALLHRYGCGPDYAIDVHRQVQDAIDNAQSWALSWHGKFGYAKTDVIRLSSSVGKATSAAPIHVPDFAIDDSPLSLVDEHRHLGLTISSDLRWKRHLSTVSATCLRKAGLLKLMAHDLPGSVIEKLYLYYLRPSMEYAAPVWHGSASEADAILLERIQCSIARRILNASWDTPKVDLLKRLGWPTLRWRREIQSLTLFFNLLRSRPPLLADSLFSFVSDSSSYNHRKPYQIILPHAKTSRFLHSFFFRSAILWNTLPHSLQSTQNPKKFRLDLEDHWQLYKFSINPTGPFQM